MMLDIFDKKGGYYVKSETISVDGNPTDFSLATVGSHVSSPTISGLTVLTKPEGATGILMQTITQNIRFTLDGSNPTASGGFQLTTGQLPVIVPCPGSYITVIQEAATASLQYQWVK